MWQSSCGCAIRSVRNENGTGSSSPGWGSSSREVDRPAVEPGRRAGLEALRARSPSDREAAGEPFGRGVARAAAGGLDLAGVHQRLEERAGRQDDGPGAVRRRRRRHADARGRDPPSTTSASTISCRSVRFVLALDGQLGEELVRLLVALGPGAVHRRALAAVEQAELDGGGVGDDAHRAAEGVDLADDLPLGDPADRRVAAHLADGVAVHRQQGGAPAHPGRRPARPRPRRGRRRPRRHHNR